MTSNHIKLSDEDAFNFLIRCLREERSESYSGYGYGVYIPSMIGIYLRQNHNIDSYHTPDLVRNLSSQFYTAAWDLCRRGILRPGVSQHGLQATIDGSAGNGYSITPFGRQWLSESDKDNYVPTEPNRFAKILDETGKSMGPGFRERAQEAVRCYGAHAYLACCVMCGAAAESVILQLAIDKSSNEHEILKTYQTAGGRTKIENYIVGKKKDPIQREFRGYTSLLSYWRDYSAHGQKADIDDNEAFTSLALLLRFTQFASENRELLTEQDQ